MIITKHVKQRFTERYRLFFYDHQLANLDKFLPAFIKEKCIERIDWKQSAWFCNKKRMNTFKDQIFIYNGKNCVINFLVKDGSLVTCMSKLDLNIPSFRSQKELIRRKGSD